MKIGGEAHIHIRQGCPSDGPALVELLASQQMETDVDPAELLVAEVNGTLLGAARLEWVGNDDAYLRPIAVAPEAQDKGVGRALLERLFLVCPKISVIARGEAIPFYHQLGFIAMDWASVPPLYRRECEVCDESDRCRPMPMRKY